MSTKFYIKDNNGIYLSTDGKIRYTLLEGKALYDFLKTENGRSRCFHVDIDENGNKIGIEAEPKMITACAAQRERDRYRHKVMTIEHLLNRNIIVAGNDAGVMIAISALRSLTPVFLCLMGTEVWRKGFASEDITAMSFIA